MAFETLNHRAKPAADATRSSEPDHSNGRYRRHDRYWLPLNQPQALRFYVNDLFVSHSRREMLRSAIARAAPWMDGAPLLDDRPHGGDRRAGKPCPQGGTTDLSGPPLLQALRLEDLACLLEEQLPRAGLVFSGPLALLMLEGGPDSARQQMVLFLFGQAVPVPCAVAKVTWQASQRVVLKHEFEALAGLHGKLGHELRSTIPRPLAFVEASGLTVLLETFAPGRSIYFEMRNRWCPRRRAFDHFRLAREWLTEFQNATLVREECLDESVIREHVMTPLETFERQCDPSAHEREMIEYVVGMARKLRDERLPLVARHGDFWARNLMMTERTAGVVDWEHFGGQSVPFEDVFMFATSYGLSYPWKLGSWADPVAAFRATYLERSWLSRLVRAYLLAYCRAMKISPEMLEVFFVVFLAGQAIGECRESEPRSPGSATIGTWRRLIREYAEQGGGVYFG
jgi:Phosphotransferase enzyme family